MKPEDFSQFDDPRVREVMAAAANLVERLDPNPNAPSNSLAGAANTLKTALFAAQHSKPPTHEKPVKFDKWGYGMAETNQFLVDGSKPGGKAFIAAVEEFDSVTGKDARGYTADDYNGRGGPGDR